MNSALIKKLSFKLLPLSVVLIVSVYLLYHPLGKTFIADQLPELKVIDLPSVTIEEQKPKTPKVSLRNPFLPGKFALTVNKRAFHTGKGGHVLSMILLGEKKTCIIDGKAVKEGDFVSKDFRILKILGTGVWVEENEEKKFIYLCPYQ